jgi:hypothetical protein
VSCIELRDLDSRRVEDWDESASWSESKSKSKRWSELMLADGHE